LPYAFAHPAAVVPIARILGARAVPSALAIGSMIPDAWYILPGLDRDATHDLAGLLLFCLPSGLFAYVAFHLLFKQPLLVLLPPSLARRLDACTSAGLPKAGWWAVLVSLVLGIATHLLWDAFTHEGTLTELALPFLEHRIAEGVPLHRVLQHASTLAGTVFLLVWLRRKLRRIEPRAEVPILGTRARIAVLAAMVLLPTAAFLGVWAGVEGVAFRVALRASGVTAICALGFVLLLFCIAWRRWLRP
jgi:hypothetical protein